jgi:hypothetical protein
MRTERVSVGATCSRQRQVGRPFLRLSVWVIGIFGLGWVHTVIPDVFRGFDDTFVGVRENTAGRVLRSIKVEQHGDGSAHDLDPNASMGPRHLISRSTTARLWSGCSQIAESDISFDSLYPTFGYCHMMVRNVIFLCDERMMTLASREMVRVASVSETSYKDGSMSELRRRRLRDYRHWQPEIRKCALVSGPSLFGCCRCRWYSAGQANSTNLSAP